MNKWKTLFVQSQNASINDKRDVCEHMCKIYKNVTELAVLCERQHAMCRFGSHELYVHVVDIIIEEVFKTATGGVIEGKKIIDINSACNDKMVLLESALSSKSGSYGAMRWLIIQSQTQVLPLSIRMLWATVFSIIWCSNNNGQENISVFMRILGDHDFRMFAYILCTLHVHFGILPITLYDYLIKVNSINS